MTERVTKGNHSIEIRSALENNIISHSWYCLPSPKNRSGHPIEYAVTQTFWPLPAIRYGDS